MAKLLRLQRTEFREKGIFGMLVDPDGTFKCFTLEESLPAQVNPTNVVSMSYAPKIPPGTYTCIRGQHRLDGMIRPFTTFEITGVPGHTGLLFHMGNTEKDTHGCVLLGSKQVLVDEPGMPQGVYDCKDAFIDFMVEQDLLQIFTLEVI